MVLIGRNAKKSVQILKKVLVRLAGRIKDLYVSRKVLGGLGWTRHSEDLESTGWSGFDL